MSNGCFEKGLVSIITPVFNSELFIEQTILSVLSQTYQKIEMILVDDCSSDDSPKIIKKFENIYKNIKYFRLDVNSGAATARNIALEKASGQFIAFLDADDLWHPEKIERQLKLLKDKEAGFAYTAIEMIDLNNNVVKSKRKVPPIVTYKKLLKNTLIATSSVLIDREKVGNVKMPNIRGGQDYATWLMVLREHKTAYGINAALTKYRTRNKNSLSGQKFKSLKQVWHIQRKQEKIPLFFAWINIHCFAFNAFKKHFL